ncbi:hypothetical protein [Bradyrhizobium sp. URHD0069]|uniref:hypothetical protein n=1 Tax=Bradyrhizobium sp. URHD0069 TaxID=1380355 RepID=UPI0018CC5587|nr:hypothetical protein [Bradyrhizobium sp. URHD0069]
MIEDVGANVKVLLPVGENTIAVPDALLMVPELKMLTVDETPPKKIAASFRDDDEIVPLLMIEPEKLPKAEIAAKPLPAIRPALLMTPEKFPLSIIVGAGPFSEITPVLVLKMPPERVAAAPVKIPWPATWMPPNVPLLMMLPVRVLLFVS